jgi:Type II secretion system (T2SS), protein E, N-terminal domain
VPDHVGPLLLRAGLITQDQLLIALAARRRSGGTLAEHIILSGAVDETRLAEFYRDRLLVPALARTDLGTVRPAVLGLIPARMAEEFRVCPVTLDREGSLILAMVDPSDTHVADEVGFFAQAFVIRAVARYSDLAWALDKHYSVVLPAAGVAAAEAAAPPEEASQPIPLTRRKTSSPILPEEPVIPLERRKTTRLVAGVPQQLPDEITDRHLGRPPAPEPSVVVELPEVSMPLDHVLAELLMAPSADDIAGIVLHFLATRCRRAAFFRVKHGRLTGRDGVGVGLHIDRLRQTSLLLDNPSLLQSIIATRLPYRGPLADAASRDFLIQAMGWAAAEAIIVPLSVRDHVVGLVYADERHAPLADDELALLAQRCGAAFERLLAERR